MRILSYVTTFALLLMPLLGFSQPKDYPDSIRVELPQQEAFIVFELRRYTDDKNLITVFPERLSALLDQIEKSISNEDKQRPHQIEINHGLSKDEIDKVTMEIAASENPKTEVMLERSTVVQLIPPGWKLKIKDRKALITVYAPDFQKLRLLTAANLEPVVTHLDTDKDTFHHKRMGTISRVVLNEGTVTPALTSHRYPGDMLGLHAGVGLGLLQEKWYPEFNLTTAVYLSSRFKQYRHRLSFHYDLKLFSGINENGSHYLGPATFLSLSYGMNFAQEKPRWTALGVGMLVHDKSGLFRGRTMRLFLETDIGSQKLNIVPELYLTDDLKKPGFGVKLNYRF